MNAVTGATPLFALEAVSFDAETTGLDPASARIVQLGLVNVSKGRVDAHTQWDTIVNPMVPMPQSAEKIHGISEEMASLAPRLGAVWPELLDRLRNRVIIGHTIGFDLTVLENEARRLSLPWTKPRALCVRMLATIVAPGLADHSLDALAAWLGVEVRDRHQALGDALATAAVFLALRDKLRDAGIETLAQAERASLRLTPEIERHQRAGWQMPVERPGTRRPPLTGFDSSAYCRTVGSIMSKPPVVTQGKTPLQEAMRIMAGKAISSVFVEEDGEIGRNVDDYGILTERDVMRRIAADGEKALSVPVGDIATRPVEYVRQDAFVYRASGRMARLKFRHLAVCDELQRLVGVVSARDLLKVRTSPALVLDDSITGATSTAELAAAWTSLPTVVNALAEEDVEPALICRIISEEIRAMTRRAAILAESEMEKAGLGSPPCRYCVMVLGSGGRGESMLVPDQDNAIVFTDGAPDASEDRWFAELGDRFASILNESGIPLCKGGVMAKNPEWRGSIATWKDRIEGWVQKSKPQDLLNVDIFFDAAAVHGDRALHREIFEFGYLRGHENFPFAKLLGETLSSVPDAFSLFGGIKGEGNKLDLKRYLLFPISAAARILAIRHNIPLQSTRERFEELGRMGIGSETDFMHLLEAQAFGFRLVLENQSRDLEAGLRASNMIDLSNLDRYRRDRLKSALRHVAIVPVLVRDHMFHHA